MSIADSFVESPKMPRVQKVPTAYKSCLAALRAMLCNDAISRHTMMLYLFPTFLVRETTGKSIRI